MATDRTEPRLCANCGAEIHWPPAMHRGKTYCCGGCAQGGPCYCSYDLASFDWLYPANRQHALDPVSSTAAARSSERFSPLPNGFTAADPDGVVE